MLPKEIEKFIEHKIEFENYCLPQFYPDASNFEQFQSGYRYNEITDESLIGSKDGDWQENWYVVCSGYANDPFIVDFSETDQNYPVYFAWHGAGHWTLIKVAHSIDKFLHHLKEIKKIENDKTHILNYLKAHFDLNNEFWKEVFQSFDEQEFEIEKEQEDWEDWILGKIFITDIGNDKIKVINFLKTELKLTPQQALLLSKQAEIEFKEGYLKHLKPIISTLEKIGATVIFKENK